MITNIKKTLTVIELFEQLKDIINDGKGEYKVLIDTEPYCRGLKKIGVLNNETFTVNLQD